MKQFYSNGKLLLTAEYLVLDGAKALALPTKSGQELTVQKVFNDELVWMSYLKTSKIWFFSTYSLSDFSFTKESDLKTAQILQNILRKSRELNPEFLRTTHGYLVKTFLSFPQDWGLGTSSTLINNISQWANVNPYSLLYKSFGGSGYDIACAKNNVPIVFQMNNENPVVEKVNFDPVFKNQLFFVHLNKKQNSGNEISNYKSIKIDHSAEIQTINRLTEEMILCNNLQEFEKILLEHENIISKVIKKKTVQKDLFSDYFGQIKSLGAWGGDFILATGDKKTPAYFKNKGFETVIRYEDMIL